VDALDDVGPLVFHSHPLAKKIPHGTILCRQLVRFGDIAQAEQLSQGEGISGIGLDLCIRDGFEILCVGKDDRDADRAQEITEPIPPCGALDDGAMILRPLAEVVRDEFGVSSWSCEPGHDRLRRPCK